MRTFRKTMALVSFLTLLSLVFGCGLLGNTGSVSLQNPLGQDTSAVPTSTSVSGSWSGLSNDNTGQIAEALQLAQNGTQVSGSWTSSGAQGNATYTILGTIVGNALSGSGSGRFGNTDVTISFTLQVGANRIEGAVTRSQFSAPENTTVSLEKQQ